MNSKFPITTQTQPDKSMGPSMGLELIQVVRGESNKTDQFCLGVWDNLLHWMDWLDTVQQQEGNLLYMEIWLITANSPDKVLIVKWQNPWSGTLSTGKTLLKEA